jgi:hypothetical protein
MVITQFYIGTTKTHYSETVDKINNHSISHNPLSPYTMSSYSSTSSHLSSRSTGRNNSIFENTIDKQESTTNMSTSNNVADYSFTSPIHSRRTINNSAVVQAMITSNNLRNCTEIEEMVSTCINNKDNESFMCKTAMRYHGGCKN